MHRATSLLGLLVIVAIAWTLSSHRRKFPWRLTMLGLGLQFLLAVVILLTPPGQALFAGIGGAFDQLQQAVRAGSGFLFRVNADSEFNVHRENLLSTFAFGVLPTIIVFSSLMSVLYHVGIMQVVVRLMAVIMRATMGVSGAESLSAAANVFVGHTEAPLVIRPYIAGLTLSELNAVMVGGFATISGGLLAAYHGMGIDAGHLVTASVISAPAALVVAKIMQPELGSPETMGGIRVKVPRTSVNLIEAAAVGASDGLKLALNVGAMLLAFLALIALCDGALAWCGSWFGQQWSLAATLGTAFWPLAWIMGVESGDCRAAGELLGLKMVANEFVAYERLGTWITGEDGPEISARTQYILTYALSGFSNFGAIGIQIGGIGGLAPQRRPDLARLGLRAMMGGMLACCMTACVAGVLMP